jgi:magnesium transporter
MKTKVQEILQDAKALREVIDSLIDDYDALLSPETLNFAKDINVHVVQIIDNLDSFRSTLSSIVDLSSAVSSNKMNDIMKFLTILSTFFLPLSLMTSWYGMNFEMPEQKTYPREGYFLFILISLCISLGFYLWFRKKKWL